MDIVYERAAGMDISKRDAKVCVRVPSDRPGQFRKQVSTYGATTGEVLRLRRDLEDAGVGVVVMEATGDYWKPFFFVLAETLNVQLVNAKQARNIPGRKTDVSDATWLAELAAHGLLRASFVPPEPIRQLRDLTRTRTHLVQEENREWARLEKNLEDSGIKLSSVVSTLKIVSARRMLDALVAGERDPHVLAGMAHTSMLKKSGALVEALTGRFTDHHAFMVSLHLDRIDAITASVSAVEERIDEVMQPFQVARELLSTIPGISTLVADVIIAEIGVDMSVFPTPGHLASWAGVCPGQNESAGRVKSTHTRPGDGYLKGTLGIAALAISRMDNNRLAARYHRVRARTTRLKAIVAIEHTVLVIVWNMLRSGLAYDDLGPDYYQRRNPDRTKNRALRQLEA
ncbi:IS110 family transposase, partial [Agromyces neolithicus]|uniref:IS110 family transposase n=1 Tax=Agromyces neolithicus TaxID=269420 RepID=UPI0031DFB351